MRLKTQRILTVSLIAAVCLIPLLIGVFGEKVINLWNVSKIWGGISGKSIFSCSKLKFNVSPEEFGQSFPCSILIEDGDQKIFYATEEMLKDPILFISHAEIPDFSFFQDAKIKSMFLEHCTILSWKGLNQINTIKELYLSSCAAHPLEKGVLPPNLEFFHIIDYSQGDYHLFSAPLRLLVINNDTRLNSISQIQGDVQRYVIHNCPNMPDTKYIGPERYPQGQAAAP